MLFPANFYFEALGRRSIPTWEFSNIHVENKKSPRGYVLFLKKVHSWEGITETIHGLFLLVL